MKKKDHTLPDYPAETTFIDSHCHLDMDAFQEDFSATLSRAEAAGIVHIISIGIDLNSSAAAIRLAQRHRQISATIGVHPHDAAGMDEEKWDQLIELYKRNTAEVKAFGEIGLDYFKNYCPPEVQRQQFSRQLAIAEELNLPVVIHNRDADADCLDILSDFNREAGCLMHCFGSDYSFARKVLDAGMMISISGVVTFTNAPDLHDVARKIPLERMLIETDGPFLAPVPFRGRRNEPAHVRFTAARIAELRGIDITEVAETTSRNTRQFFHLEEP